MNELIKKDPPTEGDIKCMRRKLREQKEAKLAFRRTTTFILFMLVIFSISFHERDTRAFALKSNVENYILADGYGQFGFAAVRFFFIFDIIYLFFDIAIFSPFLHDSQSDSFLSEPLAYS
jgi:hypothetical protein